MFLEWMGRTQLKVGDPFEVQLILESQKPIAGIAGLLSFDNRALQVVSVSESDYLKQGGAKTTFISEVDPTGKISFRGARITDNGSGGAKGPDIIATIHFRAIAPSDGALVKVINIAPVDAAGRTVSAPSLAPHVIRIQK